MLFGRVASNATEFALFIAAGFAAVAAAVSTLRLFERPQGSAPLATPPP
jgi:hypothetical protein